MGNLSGELEGDIGVVSSVSLGIGEREWRLVKLSGDIGERKWTLVNVSGHWRP